MSVAADTFKVRDFVSAIADMPAVVAGSLTALAFMGDRLIGIADRAVETGAAFHTFTEETGLSAERLQRWQIAGAGANVSADNIKSSIMGLNDAITKIRLGTGNIRPFQFLGVGVNGDTFQVLDRLREAIKGKDRAVVEGMLTEMGLSRDFVQVLELSGDKFDLLAGKSRGMTTAQIEAMQKLKGEINSIGVLESTIWNRAIADTVLWGEKVNFLSNAMKKLHDLIPGAGLPSFGSLKDMLSLQGLFSAVSAPFRQSPGAGTAAGAVINITVNGGNGGPEDVARAVSDELGRVFRLTELQLDNQGG